MVKVQELYPGDIVENFSTSAVYITQSDHPLYSGLRLVVWRLKDGSYSFDALDPQQEVGTLVKATANERIAVWKDAISFGGR